jgi:hypothetical protein
VNKWTKERDMDLKKKTDAMSRSEMADCTFTPRLSKTSERTIREMRGNVAEDFSDRLYKSSSLYTEQRYKLIESERAREEAIERMECTFQPQLATSRFNQTNQVNPKFRKPADERKPKTPEPKESFTPQVNKIKAYMNSAKAYVSTNVTDRLSKPISQQNLPNQPATPVTPMADLGGVFENNRPVMDVRHITLCRIMSLECPGTSAVLNFQLRKDANVIRPDLLNGTKERERDLARGFI